MYNVLVLVLVRTCKLTVSLSLSLLLVMRLCFCIYIIVRDANMTTRVSLVCALLHISRFHVLECALRAPLAEAVFLRPGADNIIGVVGNVDRKVIEELALSNL